VLLPHGLCPVRAHLDVELLELLQVEDSGGAVLEEALVPLLQLLFHRHKKTNKDMMSTAS